MMEVRRQAAITGPTALMVDDPRRIYTLVHRAPRPDDSSESLLEEVGRHSRF